MTHADAVLATLRAAAPAVVSRATLLQAIYADRPRPPSATGVLTVAIFNARRRLRDGETIETVSRNGAGVAWRLVEAQRRVR